MFRPMDNRIIDSEENFTIHNPIIPYGVLALNSDGSGLKMGDGITPWTNLPYQGSTSIRNKQIQSNREPQKDEILIYCDSTNKWIYRLHHCFDTKSNWESNNSIFPTSSILIELDDLTNKASGRFKIADGSTKFDDLPWFGSDFDLSNFNVGNSIEFNGNGWDPIVYLKPNELQVATIPVGKFHRDDGTWAYIEDFPTNFTTIEAIQGLFNTVYIGNFPTEPTSITLTSDGITLFVDGQKVWTEYNDGEGSGLDADTLDGHHHTSFTLSPNASTNGHIVTFGSSPNILIDSGYKLDDFATYNHTHDYGDVYSKSLSVENNIVTFNDNTGKNIKDSGYKLDDFATTGDITSLIDEDDALAYSIAFGG